MAAFNPNLPSAFDRLLTSEARSVRQPIIILCDGAAENDLSERERRTFRQAIGKREPKSFEAAIFCGSLRFRVQ